jgi:endonuclease-3
MASRSMKRDQIHEFYRRLSEAMPEPKGELNYRNPYTLLVAVVLSAQATDVGVNRATKELFKIVDTPEKMVALGEKKLISHIKTIGLYRNKAKNVIALSQMLVDDYGSEIPRDRDELTKLPGVGRKTANVVVNIAFGQPTIAVDTHIFRIGNRTGLAPGKNVDQVEVALLRRTPEEFMLHAHHWLILHGRYVCKARKPDCPSCVVADLCNFKGKTTLEA